MNMPPPSGTSGAYVWSEHPDRQRINAEFHARPPLPLPGPTRVSHIVLLHDKESSERERDHLALLDQASGWRVIEESESHCMLGYSRTEGVLVRWELHTEFSSYTLIRPLDGSTNQAPTALEVLPVGWLRAIPGRLLVLTHIDMHTATVLPPEQKIAEISTTSRQVVVTRVAGGRAWVITDFQISEGASRFLLIDAGLTPRQAGRTVQRLWEIETYRVLALLGLPVAKSIARRLSGAENALAMLMDRIGETRSAEDEFSALTELSRLAAEVEHSVADTAFRFAASSAYLAIVMQRIDELREERVQGFPPLREFMERRLLPPVNTCVAMSNRQTGLSSRIARSSQLLRTRVDLALEQQNLQVLGQMNQRARVQMRLQETVEGLSIVAITYYGSQLVHYLSKGASKLWPELSPELATAAAIPVIAALVALGLRRLRRQLAADTQAPGL